MHSILPSASQSSWTITTTAVKPSQSNLVWTDEYIESLVTPDYIICRISPEYRFHLYEPVSFGDALTNDDYLEWILRKTKRLFLTLVDIGLADQIFQLIDDSWYDDDLPISQESICQLRLGGNSPCNTDVHLNRMFYHRQFSFLVRLLDENSHVDYACNEFLPIEPVYQLPSAVPLQTWNRVILTNCPGRIFTLRRFNLSYPPTKDSLNKAFSSDVATSRQLRHRNILSVYASYTFREEGFILCDFNAQHNLQTFIESNCPSLSCPNTSIDLTCRVITWMRSLADALTFIHRKALCHAAIKPSNIFIDDHDNLALGDLACCEVLQLDKKSDRWEDYNYSAPELVSEYREDLRGLNILSMISTSSLASSSPSLLSPIASPLSASPSSTVSNVSTSTAVSTTAAAPTSLSTSSPFKLFNYVSTSRFRSKYFSHDSQSSSTSTSNSFDTSSGLFSISSKSRRFLSRGATVGGHVKALSQSSISSTDSDDTPPMPTHHSDIFSLGCIFVNLITYLLDKRWSEFTKYRRVRSRVTRSSSRLKSFPKIDVSFHANLDRVNSWLHLLQLSSQNRDLASQKFINQLITLASSMLSPAPHERPCAQQVYDNLVCIQHESSYACLPLPPLPPSPPPLHRQRQLDKGHNTSGKLFKHGQLSDYSRPLPCPHSSSPDPMVAPVAQEDNSLRSFYFESDSSRRNSIVSTNSPPSIDASYLNSPLPSLPSHPSPSFSHLKLDLDDELSLRDYLMAYESLM